jgi:hypothetical protein
MKNLDELKDRWNCMPAVHSNYDALTMKKVLNGRAGKQTKIALQYFWASLALQILVYSLLSHVVVKYWYDIAAVIPALVGILIYIPFTLTVLKKFRQLAFMKIQSNSAASIREYLSNQRIGLESILAFKNRYELFLIPLSCAIGVLLIFKLYVPEGALGNPTGAIITLAISLASCAFAIWRENKKHFYDPIRELTKVLEDYSDGG